MTLRTFLDEKNVQMPEPEYDIRSQYFVAQKIFWRHADTFIDYISEFDWNVNIKQLIEIMNEVWGEKEQIVFDKVGKKVGSLFGGKYFLSGETTPEGYTLLNMTPKAVNYLRSFKNNEAAFYSEGKNQFAREFIQVLSHELVHRKSFKKYKDIMKGAGKYDSIQEYLSKDSELLAFAQEAAIEYARYGKSRTARLYAVAFKSTNPTFQKFLKYVKKYYMDDEGEELIFK